MNLRELIEGNAGLIDKGQFGVLSQKWFFQNLKKIDCDVWDNLTDDIDDAIRQEGTAAMYLKDGGGSYAMDRAYDFCIKKVATDYIEEKAQEYKDEDESETIDYSTENPKTVNEVML